MKQLPKLNKESEGERIDSYISQIEDLSRSRVQNLIESKEILVNGKEISKSYKLKENDIISINIPDNTECETKAEDINLDIIYEDDDLIVINKPKNMVIHPAAGHYTGTLVSALLYHCGSSLSGIGGVTRPGIVHRIDKDTSGLLVAAKNDFTHIALQNQLKDHSMFRIYHAIVLGKIYEDIRVDKPIGRNIKDRKKMAITETGRCAVTNIHPIETYDLGATYIQCKLETGRTHQIRVHTASINRPILGDELYGYPNSPIEKKFSKYTNGQCLHAKQLSFIHPRTKEFVTFECKLPEYFENILEIMRKG